MNSKKLLFLALFLSASLSYNTNIGLCVMATGRYAEFALNMIKSARTYFLPGHQIHYFIFTDQKIETPSDITVIPQARLGWPYDTMLRCKVYLQHQDLYKDLDYIYAIDADMLFVDYFGNEILGDRVATIHPGFYNKRGTYDTNPQSTAYVKSSEGKHYFAGGFYGGSKEEFIAMNQTMIDHIEQDLQTKYIAVWHDESHLNRYFIDNEPTVMLDPSYCYPESWNIPFKKRLLALDKNHAECRK